MTGYGSGEATVSIDGSEVRLRVHARAVNHRFIDVRLRAPTAMSQQVPAAEELVRRRLARGRVEVTALTEGRIEALPRLDQAIARATLTQLRALRDEVAPEAEIPLGLLASVPGLFIAPGPAQDEALGGALLEACDAACDAVDAMRLREGRALAEELGRRLEAIRAKLAHVAVLCPQVVQAHRTRLQGRLERLLAERDIPLDHTRLEHEVALFAERTDVAEEVARLRSHCDQFSELMQAATPMHGRKLDFLLQEMGREVNTLGAKTPQVEITRMVVDMKADLERMREQVQNVL